MACNCGNKRRAPNGTLAPRPVAVNSATSKVAKAAQYQSATVAAPTGPVTKRQTV